MNNPASPPDASTASTTTADGARSRHGTQSGHGGSRTTYVSPFVERYSSPAMTSIFSSSYKYRIWRTLWIALAEAQKELGANIEDAQIAELIRARDTIDFDAVARYEAETHHEVAAHLRAFAMQAPGAAGVLHVGATSVFVMDNGDIVQMRDGLRVIRHRILETLKILRERAWHYRTLPALGYTHLQPAQPITVGKRIALWASSLAMDAARLEQLYSELRLRGAKGTTGTQASFGALLGSFEKVKALDHAIAVKMGFDGTYPITSQTYNRKVDCTILDMLGAIAQSAYKFSTDMRLLQGFGELEEEFGAHQVGSSAMAYKRNPIRSERITSLARFLMTLPAAAHSVASNQWLERSLDDSAARRIYIAEAFLAADALLLLWQRVIRTLTINEETIAQRLEEYIPFIATEEILIRAAQQGGDRQQIHEHIRQHAMHVRETSLHPFTNQFIERLAADDAIPLSHRELADTLNVERMVELCPLQVEEFLTQEIDPLIERLTAAQKRDGLPSAHRERANRDINENRDGDGDRDGGDGGDTMCEFDLESQAPEI